MVGWSVRNRPRGGGDVPTWLLLVAVLGPIGLFALTALLMFTIAR